MASGNRGKRDASQRAELYQRLAEALVEPDEKTGWLSLPGGQWPLYAAASRLSTGSMEMKRALERLGKIPAEPMDKRQERYRSLFCGAGRPRSWLHEGLYLKGMLYARETQEVAAVYQAAGLEVQLAENPDHATMELAFLAYTAQRQAVEQDRQSWEAIEARFIERHAGRWLPRLGQDLAGSQDAVYGPLGELLRAWIRLCKQAGMTPAPLPTGAYIPILQDVNNCSLCGFCTQVCEKRILRMQEEADSTTLLFTGGSCTGCGSCVRVCPQKVMGLAYDRTRSFAPPARLRYALRAHCPSCGRATVSQPELEWMKQKLGQTPWLELCQPCRDRAMEGDGFHPAAEIQPAMDLKQAEVMEELR